MIEMSKIDAGKKIGGLHPKDFELLAKTPLFNGLDEDAIVALIEDGHVRPVDRNTTLFSKGEVADRFYFILDGWVKLTRPSVDGNESVIAIYTKGETFAEAAMFGQGDFPVSAACVSDSRLLVIPASSVFRTFRENVDYALNVMAALSKHLRVLVRQIEQLSIHSSVERLATFFLKQCPEGEQDVVISLPIEKSLVAGHLGMQPETLSRSLAKLRDVGVSSRGNRIHIKDVQALRKLCEPQS